MSGQKGALFCLFLFLVAVYLLTGGGHFYSGDGHSIYETTRAMVDRGSLAIDPNDYVYGDYGPDGKFYSKFGMGQSFAAAPFYLCAKMGVRLLGSLGIDTLTKKSFSDLCLPVTYTLNQFVTAGLVTLFCALLLDLGMGLAPALIASLALGLTTTLWPYSKYFLSEPLLALCLLAAFYALTRKGGALSLLLAGGFLAFACLVKITALVLFPAYFLYLVLQRGKGGWFKPSLLFSTAFALGPALFLLFNQIKFGGPLNTGYSQEGDQFTWDLVTGVGGQLFSPGKSIFLYSPLLVVSVFGLFRAFKRFPKETLFCMTAFAIFAVLHGAYYSWMGGFSLGSRYLVAVVPFAFFPAAWVIDQGWQKKGLLGKVLTLLVVIGVFVQLLCLMGNYHEYGQFQKAVFPHTVESAEWNQSWSFTRSHLFAGAWQIGQGQIDLWFLTYLKRGIPALLIAPIVAVLVLTAVLTGRCLKRRIYPR